MSSRNPFDGRPDSPENDLSLLQLLVYGGAGLAIGYMTARAIRPPAERVPSRAWKHKRKKRKTFRKQQEKERKRTTIDTVKVNGVYRPVPK